MCFEIIAVGENIRDVMRLRKQYGIGRWRKLKGIAIIRLQNDKLRQAELHWYEAHYSYCKIRMKIRKKKLDIRSIHNIWDKNNLIYPIWRQPCA